MEDNAINAACLPSEGKHALPKGKIQGGSFARVPIAALVDRSLNDGDLRTLGGICAYMRKDDYAWPSQLLLGFATGRSRCAANRSVKKLESLGHITVNRYRHRDGSLRCTYQVNFKPTPLPRLPKR
jgi:Helix-turn-helix domain